jgi:FKBP-type peptidyl-prolyl cis-trans isomerase FkpA
MQSVSTCRPLSLPVLALAAVLMTGCGPTPAAPSTGAPFSQTDLRVGTGTDVALGKTVTMNYTGWLYDCARTDQKCLEFDTSIGKTPLVFTVGAAQVIPGLEQGMAGMKVGGARRIVIPSSLGYGSVRNGPIPAFSTLVFDVELLDVE